VNLGHLQLTDLLGWLFWSVAHIYFLIGLRSRFAVAFSWAWQYVTFQRGARLITGTDERDTSLIHCNSGGTRSKPPFWWGWHGRRVARGPTRAGAPIAGLDRLVPLHGRDTCAYRLDLQQLRDAIECITTDNAREARRKK
jgi:hypothetical protein